MKGLPLRQAQGEEKAATLSRSGFFRLLEKRL
jgi:hypothetical protein